MIDLALKFLQEQLTAHINAQPDLEDVDLKLSNLVNETGSIAFGENSLAMTVICLNDDPLTKSQLTGYAQLGKRPSQLLQEMNLSLHLLLAANFKDYSRAWKALYHIFAYFKAHPIFTPSEFPTLSPSIGKMAVEQEILGYEQLNHVWSIVGGKQLPSIMFRVRVLLLQEEA
jgi:hypothetical protein